MTLNSQILALDVGTSRIGVAQADLVSRIAFPLMTIEVDGSEFEKLGKLIDEHEPATLVVGYPRNQSGEPTQQTKLVEEFAAKLEQFRMDVKFQDESLTSVIAEERLKAQGKAYSKGDIDAMAAAIILSDYLESV